MDSRLRGNDDVDSRLRENDDKFAPTCQSG